MNRRMTVAELFAYSRHADVEEQQAIAMRLSTQMRSNKEEAAREQQLTRMRAQSQAQLAGTLAQAGVPGAGMMLAQQGLSPHALQMAAAMSGGTGMGGF